ncbi:MAG: beta-galactosidase [Thermoguttaceae bacterium]|nr:beta-galactosidase [Thermoguttaceae bacterium]
MKKLFPVFVLCFFLVTVSAYAQMLDRSDSRVQTTFNPGADWKVLGTVRPKSVTEITAGQNWTLGCETLDRDYIFWDTYKEYVAPLGIRRIRLQAGWAKTEKKKGVYDFAWLDEVIDDALARGLEIWLETDYGNPIYPGGGGWDLGAGFPVSEEGLAAWDRWVEELAKRYKGKVRDFAMWNEPDIGKKKTPEQIALFNIRTAETILRVNPDARIGALSLAHNDPAKVKACLDVFEREGKMHLFTWLIYHGYAPNPDSSYKNVTELQKVVDSYPHKLKLWQGENGCPSEMAHKFALSNHPWSELTQAKWDARRMLGDLGHDVVSSVFTICDFDHTGREINRKGLLKINDKKSLAKVKMAYYTVQNIASLFDLSLERQKEYAANVSDENVTWFAFRDGEKKQDVLVFWDGTKIPSESNEARKTTWTLENAQIAEPVLADVVTGRIYIIPDKNIQRDGDKLTLTEIPVYDAPLVITDRSRVLLPR